MFKKLMRKLGVSALVAILPVVLMGGVAYGADDFPSHVSSEFENVMNESSAKENDPRVTEAQANRDAAQARVDALGDTLESSIAQSENLHAAADKADKDAEAARASGDADRAETLEAAAQKLRDDAKPFDEAVDAKNDLVKAEADLAIAEQRAIDDANNQKQSVLPSTSRTIAECKVIMNQVQMDSTTAKKKFAERDDVYVKEVLACGIKTGDISLWMVPYYIRFILEFILQLGGLIAVGGIIYGGYLYLFAGLSDDKDRGKKAILYGVGGIVLAMTAWALVNIVISVVTA